MILKGNITTTSIEHKHKHTGTSSSTKCWKTTSLKPSFECSVEIWSWFSRLICLNWINNKFLPASF